MVSAPDRSVGIPVQPFVSGVVMWQVIFLGSEGFDDMAGRFVPTRITMHMRINPKVSWKRSFVAAQNRTTVNERATLPYFSKTSKVAS